MKWTKEVPTVPGWYWRKTDYAIDVVELRVRQDWLNGQPSGEPWFGFPSTPDGPFEIGDYCRHMQTLWAGPIPEPDREEPQSLIDGVMERARLWDEMPAELRAEAEALGEKIAAKVWAALTAPNVYPPCPPSFGGHVGSKPTSPKPGKY